MIVPDQAKPKAHIFYVDSRFERLARRRGGVPRQQALEQAQGQIDGLKENFDGWLDEELQQLHAAVIEIEHNPGDAAVIDHAERVCSQIRDVGATMGYQMVTFVAGSFCTILDGLKTGAIYDKDIIECHVNALLLVRTESYRNLRLNQLPEMTSGLSRVVELAGKYSRSAEN